MQKGDMKKSGEAGEVAKDMKKSDVKDFAKTKHKGLPTKKKTSEEAAGVGIVTKQNATADVPVGGEYMNVKKLFPKKKKKKESIEEAFIKPNFDYEWEEANRYPEFQKIGKDAWIKLAKKGKAVTITSAKGISNTDATEPDSFSSLDKNKQARALAQLDGDKIEMPIVAVYSDGHKELVGGNTRLTALMAKKIPAMVWQFEVPDEVANLAINKKESIAYEDIFQGLNPKSEIYVDMDGVLADFFGEWKKLVGKDWREIGKDELEPALKKIRDEEDFWLNIPLTSNAKNLLDIIKQVKENYKILSSPLADDPNSEPHKREWIEKNLDFFPPTEVIITKDKAKYATNPDGTPNILIDDYGVNISAWESAAGIGFKHKDHKFERTAKKLKAEIEESFQHLLREHIEEISAKDIGAGALAGLMALTPVSKAFGQDADTNPLPNKQTSTMVQKDVAGKKDLSKIQAPAEKDFWKVTINYKGKDVDLKLPFSAGSNKNQIKQFIDDMMSEKGVKDYAVKDIDTLNKVSIDQSILKKLIKELEKRNGKQSISYLAGMAKRAGAKPGADNAHAIAAMKAYLGK